MAEDSSNSESILIDVQFNYEDAQYGVLKFKERLNALKQEQKDLNQALKDGKVTQQDYTLQTAAITGKVQAATSAMKDYQSEITFAEKAMQSELGSYKQLSSQLEMLRKEYRQLSEEERNGARGKEMLEHMSELDKQLKQIDADMGQYFRNVGNYPSAITGLMPGFNQLQSTLSTMGVSLEALSTQGVKAFTGLGAAAKSFGTMMLTPPIALVAGVLSALYLAFNKVSEAIKKNDDTGTSLQRSFAALQPIANALNFVFDKLASAIAYVIEKGAALLSAVLDWIPGYKEARVAAQDLVTSIDNLQEAERQYVKESAARLAEVARLQTAARDEANYTAEERQRMLEEALRLLQEDTEARIANLDEQIRIDRQRAEQEQDTSDATKDRISQEVAARDQAVRQMEQQSRRIVTQLNTLSKQTGIAVNESSIQIGKLRREFETTDGQFDKTAATARAAMMAITEASKDVDLSKLREEFDATGKSALEMASEIAKSMTAKYELSWLDRLEGAFGKDNTEKLEKWASEYKKNLDFVYKTINTNVGLLEEEFNAQGKRTEEAVNKTTEDANNKVSATSKKVSSSTLKAAQDTAKKQEEISRQLRDELIKTIQDASEREVATVNASYDDQISKLKSRLETEKDLSEESREEITRIIELKENERWQKIEEIQKKYSEKETERELKAQEEAIKLKITAAKKGTEEEYQARLELLQSQYAKEISDTNLTEQEKLNIRKRYRQQTEALVRKAGEDYAKSLSDEFKDLEKELAKTSIAQWVLPEKDTAAVNKRWRAFLQEKLDALKDTLGEMAEASQEFLETQKALDDANFEASVTYMEERSEKAKTLSQGIMSSMQQSFAAMFEDGEVSFHDFCSTMLTTMLDLVEREITAIYSVILANEIASKSWAGVASAAALYAMIVAAFEAAKALVGSFATGGIIPGDSETGDKLVAHVNSGEMILNKEQQAAAYSALTGEDVTKTTLTGKKQVTLFEMLRGEYNGDSGYFASGGIVGSYVTNTITDAVQPPVTMIVDTAGLRASDIREALESMPSPVLEYSEFRKFQKRMEKGINYASIKQR